MKPRLQFTLRELLFVVSFAALGLAALSAHSKGDVAWARVAPKKGRAGECL